MTADVFVFGATLICVGLLIWLILSMSFQFHLGLLLGIGLCMFCTRRLHGFWIGDPKRRVDL